LQHFLGQNSSAEVHAALQRLHEARFDPDWTPSIAVKAMHDLDTAFLEGFLRGNVIVGWFTADEILKANLDPGLDFDGAMGMWGMTNSDDNGKASVHPNLDTLIKGNP